MAFTKLRAKTNINNYIPAGTEVVVETNSPNVFPGMEKIRLKLEQMGYDMKKLKQMTSTGNWEIIK